MNAIWGIVYDYKTEKLYNYPCCPECREPIEVLRLINKK